MITPVDLKPGLKVQIAHTNEHAEVVRFRKFMPGIYQVRVRTEDGVVKNLSHKDLDLIGAADPEESAVTAEAHTQIDALLAEAVEEGLLDKLKGAVGLGTKQDVAQDYKLVPKDQWVYLVDTYGDLVGQLANSPVEQVGKIVINLLTQLKNDKNSRHAAALLGKINQALRKKDRGALLPLVQGLKSEAEKIRTVRSGRGGARAQYESIDQIADMISEDIRANNGLIID